MKVWEYIALHLAEPMPGEDDTEVLIDKYPEDVKASLLIEIKEHGLKTTHFLSALPVEVLKYADSKTGIEELMEIDISGFIPRVIQGGK